MMLGLVVLGDKIFVCSNFPTLMRSLEVDWWFLLLFLASAVGRIQAGLNQVEIALKKKIIDKVDSENERITIGSSWLIMEHLQSKWGLILFEELEWGKNNAFADV